MDLPIDKKELIIIIDMLYKTGHQQLADKLALTLRLMSEGKAYKKVLREQFHIVS
jgi:hypothetical protein